MWKEEKATRTGINTIFASAKKGLPQYRSSLFLY